MKKFVLLIVLFAGMPLISCSNDPVEEEAKAVITDVEILSPDKDKDEPIGGNNGNN